MTTDADILRRVHDAFATCERPTHFTDYMHCPECAEHDELLRTRTPETLTLDDVGNPGWDPLCFVEPTGFAYYFPSLARLVLVAPDAEHDWYGPQLLFHLTYEEVTNRHFLHCTSDQRHAVALLLRHLHDTQAAWVSEWCCAEALQTAIMLWSADAES